MRVLIAVDGSDYSQKALEMCCAMLSAKEHLDIRVVSVIEPIVPMSSEPFGVSNEYYAKMHTEQVTHGKTMTDNAAFFVKNAFADADVTVEVDLCSGSPKRTIIDEAREWKADLLVVGSHGYGYFERVFLGSVSNYVVHHAPCSVMIVRTQDEE